MESRTLVFILMGVFILLLIAVFFIPRENIEGVTKTFKSENVPETCKKECGDNNLCIEQCKTALLNQASLSGDNRKCDEFKGEEREDCLGSLKLSRALASGDVGLCTGLKNEDNCKDMVLYNKYLQTKDKSICGQLIDAGAKEACLNG